MVLRRSFRKAESRGVFGAGTRPDEVPACRLGPRAGRQGVMQRRSVLFDELGGGWGAAGHEVGAAEESSFRRFDCSEG
jgi:hypothetical protein